MSETNSSAPAGWYPDVHRVDTLRYWNGQGWEEKWAPTTPPVPPPPDGLDTPESNGAITAGYIFAVLIPFIGLIIGLTQIGKKGAVGVIITSIAAFAVWYLILTANSGGGSYGYY